MKQLDEELKKEEVDKETKLREEVRTEIMQQHPQLQSQQQHFEQNPQGQDVQPTSIDDSARRARREAVLVKIRELKGALAHSVVERSSHPRFTEKRKFHKSGRSRHHKWRRGLGPSDDISGNGPSDDPMMGASLSHTLSISFTLSYTHATYLSLTLPHLNPNTHNRV